MRWMLMIALCCPALAAQPELETRLAERDRKIADLERRLEHLESHHTHDEEPKKKKRDHDADARGVWFELLDLSFNLMTVVGTSTSTDDELRGLQIGGHDPRRRGFTLQQAELAFAGALQPYFAAEAYLVATEETVELEEAFLRSLFLPWFELKAGYFFTEFGRMNRVHPHGWTWADQPVALGRVLGAEGLRGVGGRAALHAGWGSLLFSVQNADDESATSFLGEGHGHGHQDEHGGETVGGLPRSERRTRTLADLLYLLRMETSHEFGHWTLGAGASGAYGPNATGERGKTWLAGADAALKWQGHESWFRVQAEFLHRYFQAGPAVFENDPSDPSDDKFFRPTVLHDWGAYLEVSGSPGWNLLLGLRLEYASGFRSGHELRQEDPLRDDRLRISPMVGWQPLDQLKVTLQYNFDHTEHLGGKTSHGLWLGIRVMFGVDGHKH
ncbi:MAG: hypothetical protein KF754_12110 [Planctomycetes bacterium]|nr:hypothetical protein [Planctomycetota bacterium]